jgi:hypothetical protein
LTGVILNKESDNEGNPHCLTCSGLQTQIHKTGAFSFIVGSLPFSFTDLLPNPFFQTPNRETSGMVMQKFTVNITTTAGQAGRQAGSELYALQKPD